MAIAAITATTMMRVRFDSLASIRRSGTAIVSRIVDSREAFCNEQPLLCVRCGRELPLQQLRDQLFELVKVDGLRNVGIAACPNRLRLKLFCVMRSNRDARRCRQLRALT